MNIELINKKLKETFPKNKFEIITVSNPSSFEIECAIKTGENKNAILKINWSEKTKSDLKNFHGIKIEEDLEKIIYEELVNELNKYLKFS